MTNKSRRRSSRIAWGFFWFLLAGLILANSIGDFVQLGVWSIIIGALAAVILFHCLATLSLASIPIPLAALYYIFQSPLGLPPVGFWTIAVVAVLLTAGLHVILPRRFSSGKFIDVHVGKTSRKRYGSGENVRVKVGDKVLVDIDDADVVIDGGEQVGAGTGQNRNGGDNGYNYEGTRTQIDEGDDPNNPYFSVSFGGASRYLHADCLKTAELNCSFGSLEVYFDNVTLSPYGAEVNVNCSFGSIEIYVPSHWRVIDDMNASLANAEVSRRLQSNDSDAPTIRVTGSVSLGNVEVNRIKGS